MTASQARSALFILASTSLAAACEPSVPDDLASFSWVHRLDGRWCAHVTVSTRVDDPFTAVTLSDSFDVWATNPLPSCP